MATLDDILPRLSNSKVCSVLIRLLECASQLSHSYALPLICHGVVLFYDPVALLASLIASSYGADRGRTFVWHIEEISSKLCEI